MQVQLAARVARASAAVALGEAEVLRLVQVLPARATVVGHLRAPRSVGAPAALRTPRTFLVW